MNKTRTTILRYFKDGGYYLMMNRGQWYKRIACQYYDTAADEWKLGHR